MTIYDLKMVLTTEEEFIRIFDIECNIVFDGQYEDIPTEYEDENIMSVDIIATDKNRYYLDVYLDIEE